MARERGGRQVNGARRGVVVIGPTPPPYHGMSIFTRQILRSPVLNGAFQLYHVETADRRPLDNMGRLDLRNVWLALRHSAALVREIVRSRPALVYIAVSQNGLAYMRDSAFIVIGRALRCRVVTHLHGSDFRAFYERSSPALRWLIRWTSRRLSAAAVLGPGLKSLYAGLIPDTRIHVVTNGVEDPCPEGVQRPGKPAEGRRLTVTYLGMLFEPKGFLDLLRAAVRLRALDPTIRFVFAGEWYSERERRAAESLVQAGALEGTVVFPGAVDGGAKQDLLRQSDVLVFPGYQAEGLPLVILEAMAAGLPVIATDTGLVREAVVHGETGLIVDMQAPDALAAAIRQLVQHEDVRLRMGAAGRRRYLSEFTDTMCAQRLVTFLDAACAETRARA